MKRISCLFSNLQIISDLRILTGKKRPSNKTPVLTKCMNTDIWVVDTSNQLLIRVY